MPIRKHNVYYKLFFLKKFNFYCTWISFSITTTCLNIRITPIPFSRVFFFHTFICVNVWVANFMEDVTLDLFYRYIPFDKLSRITDRISKFKRLKSIPKWCSCAFIWIKFISLHYIERTHTHTNKYVFLISHLFSCCSSNHPMWNEIKCKESKGLTDVRLELIGHQKYSQAIFYHEHFCWKSKDSNVIASEKCNNWKIGVQMVKGKATIKLVKRNHKENELRGKLNSPVSILVLFIYFNFSCDFAFGHLICICVRKSALSLSLCRYLCFCLSLQSFKNSK